MSIYNINSKIMSFRIDWFLGGLIVGAGICINSCSAISTLKSFSWLCFPSAAFACLILLSLRDYEKDGCSLTGGALVFALPIFISGVVNLSYSNVVNSITLLTIVFLAYLCVRKIGPLRLCRLFVLLMSVTAAASLILWVFTNLIVLDLPLPVLENVNGIHYKTLIIASQYSESFVHGSSSMGFFWEPGVFASYLLLAVVVDFMTQERPSKFRLVVFLAALISTGSTAGYVLLPVALSVGLLKKGDRSRVVIAIILLFIFLIFLVYYSATVNWLFDLNPAVFGKLVDTDAVTRLTRIQSPKVCWDLFLQNPYFGLGYGGALDAYTACIASTSTVDSLTSTSFFQLAAFGFSGFVMWGLTIYGVLGTNRLPLLASVTFLLLFGLILNKEPHTASALTYVLIFSFLAFKDSKTAGRGMRGVGNVREIKS